MNTFTNSKKTKKFILVLVLLILFNFCCPKPVKAFDIWGGIASIFFLLEEGIISLLNDIFCDQEHLYGGTGTEVFLTPENIIKGKFILFNADIFSKIDISSDEYFDEGLGWLIGNDVSAGAREELRLDIAGWYYSLLNFSVVALLIVLVYVGIRMITSSISQDKAKYKIMFKDWLVAMCLLFVMHFMMIGILKICNVITKSLGTVEGGNHISSILLRTRYIIDDPNDVSEWWDDDECDGNVVGCRYHEHDDNACPNCPDERSCDRLRHYTVGDAYAYIVVLIGMIGMTFIFGWKYLKRLFTMIFLILLGPLSCITYPIDKISDGKSQAYNRWFSEFLYNALIQPFHLILYYVLVGSAVELAEHNLLYSIACFAILIPSEKFVKEMFGFKDKLGTPLGQFAGGAIAGQAISKAMSAARTVKGKDSKGTSGGDGIEGKLPAKTKNIDNLQKDSGSQSSSGNNDEEFNSMPVSMGEDNRENLEDNQNKAIGDNREENLQMLDSAEGQEGGEENLQMVDTAEGQEDGKENLQMMNGTEGIEGEVENPQMGDAMSTAGDLIGGATVANAVASGNSSFMSRGVDALKEDRLKRLARKYGTIDPDKIAMERTKRAGKFAGRTIKKATTITASLAGAAAFGLVGTMFGKGKEAAAFGGAIGVSTGKGVGNLADKVTSTIGEKTGVFWNAATNKDINKEKYKGNATNLARAQRYFKDKNGRVGNREEIGAALETMYQMSEFGVKDENMEYALGQYEENKDAGMTDLDALEFATRSALLAQTYGVKDFKDEKLMNKIYEENYNKFAQRYGEGELADQRARHVLSGAGAIKGVNTAMPPERIFLPQNDINLATQTLNAGGINSPTNNQIKQEVELNRKLRNSGYTTEQIKQLSGMSELGNKKTIVDRAVKLKTELENNPNSYQVVEGYTPEQEIVERMSFEEIGVTDQDKISSLRNLDLSKLDKSDFDNEKLMDKIENDYTNRLVRDGGFSAEFANERATQIIYDAKEGINTTLSKEIEIQHNLIEKGFDDIQIQKLHDMATKEKGRYENYELLVNRVINVKQDEKAREELEKAIGSGVSDNEMNVEIIERMHWENKGVQDQSKISRLREMETNYSQGDKRKIEEARRYVDKAIKNKGRLSQLDKSKLDGDLVAFAELGAESIEVKNK